MARTPSITREQVTEIATKLASSGETPSVRKIRDVLGAGSNATIQAHLHAWQATQPAQTETRIELSEGLVTALRTELERIHIEATTQAKETHERALRALRASELEVAGLEDKVEDAEKRAATHRQAQQVAEGRCAELMRQLERYQAQQDELSQAQRELAAARAQLELLKPRAEMVDGLLTRIASLEAAQPKALTQ